MEREYSQIATTIPGKRGRLTVGDVSGSIDVQLLEKRGLQYWI